MIQKLYSQMLEEIFEDYDGENKDLLKKIPIYFNILQKVYSENLDWISKFKINCCFSYFGVSQDVIDDSVGPQGYYDDLFVCAYVIKDIIPNYKKEILRYWDSKDNMEESINELIDRLKNLLGERVNNILHFTGLSRFNRILEDSISREFKDDIRDRTSMIQLELLDLIGLLRTLLLADKTNPGELNKLSELTMLRIRILKEEFKEEEWNQVISLLEKIEVHESKFDNSNEIEKEKDRERVLKRIEEIRRKVLLNINEALTDD
jgi:uncharacterized membrane protein YkvA (DUF1232 family)